MTYHPSNRRITKRRRPPSTVPYETLEQRHLLAALVNGQEIVDNVLVGETNTYEIEVTTPGKVYVSVGETFDFDSEVSVEISSPSNAFVASGIDNAGMNLDFSANELGTYQVQVSDSQNDNGFQFRIRSLAINQPYELVEGRDKLLANGEEIITAYPENGLGVYQISVEPTENVEKYLLLAGTTPNIENGIEQQFRADVIKPNGQIAFEGQVLRRIIYAGNPGIYTVIVQNEGDASDFQLRNFDFAEPLQLIEGRDAILANGQEQLVQVPAQGVGLVQFDLEKDVPTFVSVSPGSDPNNVVQWNLRDPDGFAVESSTSLNSGVIEFEPFKSGRYTLMVEPQNRLESIEAHVRVLSTASPYQFVAGRDKPLANGERVTAEVPARGFNAYSVEINELEALRVLLDTPDYNSTPSVLVIGPSGAVIDDVFSDEFDTKMFADEPGTYTLLIANDTASAINITLRPIAFSENLTSFVDNESFLLDGSEVTDVVTRSNRFVFQFDADELDEVELFVQDLSDPFSNQLRLTVFEPSGEAVTLDDFGYFNAEVNAFTAATSGVYTGIIESTDSFSGLDPATLFSLGLFVTGPETPLAISLFRDQKPASEPQQLARPDQLNELQFGFNLSVAQSQSAFDMTLADESTFFLNFADFAYDPTTRVATFDLSPTAPQPMPGFYTVAISPGSLSTLLSNQQIPEGFLETFYVAIPGDTDLNGVVDVLGDAASLVNNLGVTENATWADGDFNGDGIVDVLSDAAILVENLGSSVTVPDAGETSVAFAPAALIARPTDDTRDKYPFFEPSAGLFASDELTLTGAITRDAAFAELLDV